MSPAIPRPRKGERAAVKRYEREQEEREMAAAKRAWSNGVGKVCAMCGNAGRLGIEPITPQIREDFFNELLRIEGHHLIPKADLRKMGVRPRDRYDLRLKLDLCRYHHARHENLVERVPRELYWHFVFEYAEQHNVLWLLEREIAIVAG